MTEIWTTERADKKFSEQIRTRDPICKKCNRRPSTDCSHYYERHHSATRFDPRNGDGICRQCHSLWEGRKNGYEAYKRRQLGARGYIDLQRLAYSVMKRDEAIIKFMKRHES